MHTLRKTHAPSIASNEIRTRVIGFKVQCANHYTMEAKTSCLRLSPHYEMMMCLYIKIMI